MNDSPEDIRQHQITLRGMIAFRESRGCSRRDVIRAREDREMRALRWAAGEAERQSRGSEPLPPDADDERGRDVGRAVAGA